MITFIKYKVLVLLLVLHVFNIGFGQDSLKINQWSIGLPLRFTHLQSKNTMLSGIKVGRNLTERVSIYLSIYHSFYLKSFKSTAQINGLQGQPRLFINGIGAECEYFILRKKNIFVSAQLLLGWGFMKYDLETNDFESKQVNYFLVEPVINFDVPISKTNFVGIGFGYRPILSNASILFESDVASGALPILKELPNGINLIITFKGVF